MDVLPEEIINEILLRVDRPTLYEVSYVCRQWYHLSLKQVVIITTRKQFKRCCKQGDKLSIVHATYEANWLNFGLYGACRGGHLELAKLLIRKGANDLNQAFYGACRSGNSSLIEIFQGASCNKGLDGACYGGHLELAKSMISKGARDYDASLYYASRGGHLVLVELLISTGVCDYNNGLYGACCGGHLQLAELMIIKGADDYYEAFRAASYGGHLPLIELVISKLVIEYWNEGLYYACWGGHIEAVEFMISKGADDWNRGLKAAHYKQREHIKQLMIAKGGTIDNIM